MAQERFHPSVAKLHRPPPKADRLPGGEWDWFYELDRYQRADISRNYMSPDGWWPEDVATDLGCTVNEAMERFLQAVRVIKAAGLDEEQPESVYASELMGPAEVCELLECPRETLRTWRSRDQFPPAVLELSGLPIWTRSQVETWAFESGRLVDAPACEAF